MGSPGFRWMRPVTVVVGVLAASSLVWFVGPLVAVAGVVPLAGEPARWAAIAALIAVALADAAWRQLRAARHNRRLMEGLLARGEDAAGGAPGAKEVALL